jgi:hypothetical protein
VLDAELNDTLGGHAVSLTAASGSRFTA